MTAIGVDPGMDGAVAVLQEGAIVDACLARQYVAKTGKGSRQDYLPQEMSRLISKWASPSTLVVLERQGARPGQGTTSMFSTGMGYGLWIGILAALQVRYVLVHPSTWAAKLLKDSPGEGKARAIHVCGRLLPELNLVRPGCRKPHSGLADAGLLAYWGALTQGKEE